MPNPSTPTSPNGSYVDLGQAPGADMNFDELFPVEDQNLGAPQSPQGTTPPTPEAQPPVAQQPDFFIKAGSTVYKTSEDAVQGIRHKDTLIAQYRKFLADKGVNPDTLQANQVQAPPQVAQPVDQSPQSYINHEDTLFDDLASAISRGDKKGYGKLLAKYNNELMTEQFAPVAPLISEVARQRAVRQVTMEAPEFASFVTSENYGSTLDSLPRLKEAINVAENNFAASDSLGELYKIAYLAYQGSRKPAEQVVPATQAQPVVAAQNQQTFRPTQTPSAMTPPMPSSPADLRTSAGRQTLIREAEARGIKDMIF